LAARRNNIAAFQLALWEVSHDTNLSLTSTGSPTTEFYVSTAPASGNTLTSYNTALSMVAAVKAANVQTTYASTTWQVVLLENSSFTPGAIGTVQDLVYATAIPEATTAMLTLAGLTLLATRRRRRSA
jgi:MYXO-CTERM domain-containing protein